VPLMVMETLRLMCTSCHECRASQRAGPGGPNQTCLSKV